MIGYPETSIRNYPSTTHETPEVHRSVHRGRKLNLYKFNLEVNTEKTECVFVFRKQNLEKNNNVKEDNKTFDKVT